MDGGGRRSPPGTYPLCSRSDAVTCINVFVGVTFFFFCHFKYSYTLQHVPCNKHSIGSTHFSTLNFHDALWVRGNVCPLIILPGSQKGFSIGQWHCLLFDRFVISIYNQSIYLFLSLSHFLSSFMWQDLTKQITKSKQIVLSKLHKANGTK